MKQAIPEGQTCPACHLRLCLEYLEGSESFFKAGVPAIRSTGRIQGFAGAQFRADRRTNKQKPRSLEQDLAAVLRLESHRLQLRVSLLIAGLAPTILLLLQREYFFERGSCY